MDQSAVKELKRQYKREWYKKNKEKCKEYMDRYWAKKAMQATENRC